MNDDGSIDDLAAEMEKEAVQKAMKTLFTSMMKKGNNFMEGTIFADGHIFKVMVQISNEIIE